jgi:L,D-transpeptidase YcbB
MGPWSHGPVRGGQDRVHFFRGRPNAPTVKILVLAAVLIANAPAAGQIDARVEQLRQRVEAGEAAGQITVADTPLVNARLLSRLYEMHGYEPFWKREQFPELTALIEGAAADGLVPADYHLAALARSAASTGSSAQAAADADLLATDAFALLLFHLYFGKVDPVSLDSHWNFDSRQVREQDVVKFLFDVLNEKRYTEAIARVRPQHWLYAAGLNALGTYRKIAAAGGWPQVASGATLQLGVTDARVPVLRQRLAATGDLTDLTSNPSFDAALAEAVKSFQQRHLLTADGTVGPTTLREINVPVEARIGQLRANLERSRAVLHEIKDGDLVVVDVAGFGVRFLRDRKTVWKSRVQIGKPYRQTPIFKSMIDHVVINPTWTVPPGILARDILPAAARDPLYVQKRKLQVIDRNGREVESSSVDWKQYAGGKGFPYQLRQPGGEDNALGRVKMMFANPYLVYLHDTPSRTLFEQDDRAFSSGCIRVQRPFELVELLLNDPKWDAAALEQAVTTGNTLTVRLATSVPVLIMYWTAELDDQGKVIFKRDPYGRDARVLAALDRPFVAGREVRTKRSAINP